MTTPETDLQGAIEQSYAAFSATPRPCRSAALSLRTTDKVIPVLRKLADSLWRTEDQILATLYARPLREVTGKEIGPYSSRAMTTVGNNQDYRYFLPRVFELSINDPVWLGVDPAIMADKLRMADWHSWPDYEQQAVLGFFRAAFDWAIDRHPDQGPSAADWACGLMALGDPSSRTSDRWLSASSPNAALQLSTFIIDVIEFLRRHHDILGGFWRYVDVTARRELAEWLTSDASKAFLRTAARHVTGEDRLTLLEALAELER